MTPQLESILDRITACMEQGELPWRRPWTTSGRPTVPIRSDGKPFSGTNLLLLSFVQFDAGYGSQYWLTYKQAQTLGGQVKAGSSGAPAILYKTSTKRDEETDEETFRRYMKSYTVFNAEQVSGLPEEFYAAPSQAPLPTNDEVSEFFARMPVTINHYGDQAYYSPSRDVVVMPPHDRWKTTNERGEAVFDHANYNATLAHEMIHMTGHESRLNRDFSKYKVAEHRAREELVAELGSILLGYQLGLPVDQHLFENHAAYLQSWVSILKDTPGELLRAAAKAQSAVDWINRAAGTAADNDTETQPLAA